MKAGNCDSAKTESILLKCQSSCYVVLRCVILKLMKLNNRSLSSNRSAMFSSTKNAKH